MQLNANLAQRVVVHHPSLPWMASPAPGIHRRLIERDGEEVARATSVVRYEAGSQFPCHNHDLGEEIFVLEGTLTDEHGSNVGGWLIDDAPLRLLLIDFLTIPGIKIEVIPVEGGPIGEFNNGVLHSNPLTESGDKIRL